MFLDDTACNLASLNLAKFFNGGRAVRPRDSFRHAVRLWTDRAGDQRVDGLVPEPSDCAEELSSSAHWGWATPTSARCSCGRAFPTIHQKAMAICGAITAIMTGESYATSAEMAAELGPFPATIENRDPMLRVIRNHRRAAYSAAA